MRKGGGGAKGGSFERKIGAALSLWLTNGADKSQLIRSVMSGGWKHRGQRQAGDLSANGEFGELFRARFVVECKHRAKIDLMHLWTAGENADKLPQWWSKLRSECTGIVSPMLVYRSNGQPIMVAVQHSRLSHQQAVNDASGGKHIIIPHYDMLILPFETFLTTQPCEWGITAPRR